MKEEYEKIREKFNTEMTAADEVRTSIEADNANANILINTFLEVSDTVPTTQHIEEFGSHSG